MDPALLVSVVAKQTIQIDQNSLFVELFVFLLLRTHYHDIKCSENSFRFV